MEGQEKHFRMSPTTPICTLQSFILQGLLKSPNARGDFTVLLEQIALAAKLITARVRREGVPAWLGGPRDDGLPLGQFAGEVFLQLLRDCPPCAGFANPELSAPVVFPGSEGKYLVIANPLDGVRNLASGTEVGTTFGILAVDPEEKSIGLKSFLRPGKEWLAAGYLLFGTSTLLVLTTGKKAHSFTWDPYSGEFFLTNTGFRCPERGSVYSINEGSTAFWTENSKRWVSYLKELAPQDARPYSLRYSGAAVADVHRVLQGGGIFAYPADRSQPKGKLRLLFDAIPLAAIAKSSGGDATTGSEDILNIVPSTLSDTTPFAAGSRADIERYREFFREDTAVKNPE